ncbi:MAG: PaaI family thioesterase [Pseudomonadales bacterium]
MPEPFEVLAARLSASPFWSGVGWRLENADSGNVRIRLPYSKDNTTAATALHGGAIAATLDVAGCLAAYSTGVADGDFARTLACDVSYIAGALGEDIFGQAQVLRRGKEVVYARVEARNGDDKLLAVSNHISHVAPGRTPGSPPDRKPEFETAPLRHPVGIGSIPLLAKDTVDRNITLLEQMDGRMPYMAQLGWTFIRGADGYAEFRLPGSGRACGEDGMLAGGALLSAVDHAGSLAAWMTNTLGDRTLFGSTINTKLQTFAPVVNRDVIVKARAVGGDRTLVNAVVDIVTEQGEYIASGSTVYRIVKRNPEG